MQKKKKFNLTHPCIFLSLAVDEPSPRDYLTSQISFLTTKKVLLLSAFIGYPDGFSTAVRLDSWIPNLFVQLLQKTMVSQRCAPPPPE